MIVLEFKARVKPAQATAIEDAIRTAQFVRNKALRYWMDSQDVGKYDLSKLCKALAEEFPFAKKLNSMARQASAERAWSSISRFYDNCKKGIKPVGFPRFKKHSRSVEYKTSDGSVVEAPQFYRKSERRLNKANREKSRKYRKGAKPQSGNYHRARNRYARKHLRVSRQRNEWAKSIAYCVIQSNDLVAYVDAKRRAEGRLECERVSTQSASSQVD
ncbi:putative transposase [Arthrospira platensis C1]|nr:putative transposase [Arthrospira platensis C1]